MAPTYSKAAMRALLCLAGGLALALLLAEAALQLLPVNRGLAYADINAGQPIPRMQPGQSITWSRGCDFTQVNGVTTNAEGYTDRQDFAATPGIPVAIIGDSYIEALMAAPGTAIDERVEQYSGNRIGGLRMGISGAQAATHAVLAAHAVTAHNARAVVIVISAGDFTNANQPMAGLYHYSADGAATLAPYQVSRLRQLLKKSALLSYFRFNCQPDFRAGGDIHMAGQPGNDDPVVAPTISGDTAVTTRRHMDYFLASLRDTGLPADRILFLVDGNRRGLYPHAGEVTAGDDSERADFIAAARKQGHEVIDLMEAFRADFAARGGYFEYPLDSHWNADGHRVAATAVLASTTIRQLLPTELHLEPH